MAGGYCIRCGKCHMESDMSAWVDGLPMDYYKCPECGVIVHKVYGEYRVITLHNGETLFVPRDIKIIEEPPPGSGELNTI